MFAAWVFAALPACVPTAGGYGYLPTPRPCVVLLVDPRTGEREELVVRWPWGPAPVLAPVPGFDARDFLIKKKR